VQFNEISLFQLHLIYRFNLLEVLFSFLKLDKGVSDLDLVGRNLQAFFVSIYDG
jgi:hypothetical protein